MRGKLILYGIGGGGINTLSAIHKELMNLGEGFAEVELRTLDTTTKTIDKHPELTDTFYKIDSQRVSTDALDGLAGERKNREAVLDIQNALKQYMDTKIGPNKKNEYHTLIFTGSGGSGSVTASILISLLRQKDYNTLPIVIGDEANLLYVTNTINTLVGLNNIAKKTGTALPIVYFNNSINGITNYKYENETNSNVEKFLSIFSMAVSGDVQDIDQQDMSNFLHPTRYKSFQVEPGLYTMGVKIKELNDYNTIIARTIVIPENKNYKIEVPLLHNKVGIANLNHIEIFGDKAFPCYLTFKKNEINTIVEKLQERHKNLEEIKQVKSSTLDKLSDAIEDDDLGLVM